METKTVESFSIGEPVWKCFRVGLDGPSFEISEVVGIDGEFVLVTDLVKRNPIKFPPHALFKLTDLDGMQELFDKAIDEINDRREKIRQAVQLVKNMDTDPAFREVIKDQYPEVYGRWSKYQSMSGK